MLGRILWGVCLGLMTTISFAIESEHIVWEKKPIALTLEVGKELMLVFPHENLSVGRPGSLSQSLKSQSIENVIYWQASAPFSSKRIRVRENTTGKFFLFDVKALESGTDQNTQTTPITILLKDTAKAKTGIAKAQHLFSDQNNLSYAALTQYVAQQFYAPSRLLKDNQKIRPVVLKIPNNASIPLYRGGKISATPLMSYRSGGLYITAIKLANATKDAVILDPRNIRGQFKAATFQHNKLDIAGSHGDTTAVYLISNRPFTQALYPYYQAPPLPDDMHVKSQATLQAISYQHNQEDESWDKQDEKPGDGLHAKSRSALEKAGYIFDADTLSWEK
jgi:integrating conjugative element protein (TIGR03749 family)